jgi:hypothetical protein
MVLGPAAMLNAVRRPETRENRLGSVLSCHSHCWPGPSLKQAVTVLPASTWVKPISEVHVAHGASLRSDPL